MQEVDYLKLFMSYRLDPTNKAHDVIIRSHLASLKVTNPKEGELVEKIYADKKAKIEKEKQADAERQKEEENTSKEIKQAMQDKVRVGVIKEEIPVGFIEKEEEIVEEEGEEEEEIKPKKPERKSKK